VANTLLAPSSTWWNWHRHGADQRGGRATVNAMTPGLKNRVQIETLFFFAVFITVLFRLDSQEPSIHAGYSPICGSGPGHQNTESQRFITPQNPRIS